MIQIEYIHTEEVYCPAINNYEKEDKVVKPAKKFNNLDEAWAYAMAHGCNPYKLFKVREVD